ncbi:HD domain-containing protein [Marinobacter zhejiangensis]|uniref:Phosphonate degradation operons associated HDIG domain protein n=1 Tax=Marinobacter zhejiangensis TaxID=488535 RepID=A0A1I4Q5D0_9GAMM|nr:HD domain-containing protein [Marinobacter zhejiangensis]SFM34875.1 phosphonate degradation operons associated HDIG domain protein [Marinobacter zhejiangensis]
MTVQLKEAPSLPTHNTIVDFIEGIFQRRGSDAYLGESVTMAEHMLQAAWCAEQDGGTPEMIAAALLHDLGHFTSEIPEDRLMKGTDNFHQEAGARFLERFFPDEVVEPIRQHVAAKRYLCAVDPDYFGKLSDASVYTLELQGGPMSADEVAAFERNPHLDSCIRVRLWDDQGKDPDMPHPGFKRYRPLLESLIVAR